jgi:tetratricopeptide (TPR) repeat protein
LQLLSASAATLGEVEEVASAMLARTPDFAPALLAKAVAAGERGRAREAASAYALLAAHWEALGARVDEASARMAAAEQHLAAGDAAAATTEVERALERQPDHRGAWRALTDRLASEERWSDLLKVLRQRAASEPDVAARAALQAESGLVLLERLGDRTRARQCFEHALRLSAEEPAAWEGTGQLQALAGERDAAALSLERARRLLRLPRAPPGPGAGGGGAGRPGSGGRPRRGGAGAAAAGGGSGSRSRLSPARGGRAGLPAGRPAEASSALQAALGRARRPRERVVVLRRLAAVEAQGRGDAVAARVLLEQALQERPADLQALDDMQALLSSEGQLDEMEPFLRRAFERSGSVEERVALLVRLADLARATGAGPLLAEALAALAAAGGPEGAAAAAELGARAEASGDPAQMSWAAALLERTLASEDASLPGALRAELSFRLGLLRERQGDEAAALRLMGLCLKATPRARWPAAPGCARPRSPSGGATSPSPRAPGPAWPTMAAPATTGARAPARCCGRPACIAIASAFWTRRRPCWSARWAWTRRTRRPSWSGPRPWSSRDSGRGWPGPCATAGRAGGTIAPSWCTAWPTCCRRAWASTTTAPISCIACSSATRAIGARVWAWPAICGGAATSRRARAITSGCSRPARRRVPRRRRRPRRPTCASGSGRGWWAS